MESQLTTHESAAYTIARRGLGFQEKLSVYSCEAKRVKKVHSWVLWSKLKAVLTGLRNKTYDLQELYGYFRDDSDDSENLLSEALRSELIVGSNCNNIILADERLPCKVVNFTTLLN